MQQKSTSLLGSYSKAKTNVGQQNSQALQGEQEKMWVFLILVWTKYLETGWAQEYFQKKSLKFEMQN